jgi:hypothetical protein
MNFFLWNKIANFYPTPNLEDLVSLFTPPVSWWPSYIPWHWVPFSSPSKVLVRILTCLHTGTRLYLNYIWIDLWRVLGALVVLVDETDKSQTRQIKSSYVSRNQSWEQNQSLNMIWTSICKLHPFPSQYIDVTSTLTLSPWTPMHAHWSLITSRYHSLPLPFWPHVQTVTPF